MSVLAITSYTFTTVLQPYMPVFYVSFLVTIVLTPLMRFLAHRHGIVDDPDGRRKVHTQPIAYLGGVSIFLGWLAGVSISVFLRPHNAESLMLNTIQIPPGILLGAAVVVLFGLMDDVYSLSPKIKLFGQFLAALFLILPSVLFNPDNDYFLNPGHGASWMVILPLEVRGYLPNLVMLDPVTQQWISLAAGLFSALFAIFIIVSACNATNLLDGLDGLCSGVTGIMSFGYLILAAYLAYAIVGTAGGTPLDPARITIALALLGAVLGFLPFNFNPASIFMGDTGSMFLGYICGTMMLLFAQQGTIRWFLSAVVIFGLPMLDTFLAIVRRKLNGRPIFSPDSNHFHHFLIRRGFSVRKAVFLGYAVSAIFVSFALVIVIVPTRMAIGLYLVLFGWLVVAAFKIGMIFQHTKPQIINADISAEFLNGSTTLKATPATPSVPSPLTQHN